MNNSFILVIFVNFLVECHLQCIGIGYCKTLHEMQLDMLPDVNQDESIVNSSLELHCASS